MYDYPRLVVQCGNGVIASVVNLFPGEEKPIEVLIVDGEAEDLQSLDFMAFPVDDPFRYSPQELPNFIDSLAAVCGGIKAIAFDRKDLFNG